MYRTEQKIISESDGYGDDISQRLSENPILTQDCFFQRGTLIHLREVPYKEEYNYREIAINNNNLYNNNINHNNRLTFNAESNPHLFTNQPQSPQINHFEYNINFNFNRTNSYQDSNGGFQIHQQESSLNNVNKVNGTTCDQIGENRQTKTLKFNQTPLQGYGGEYVYQSQEEQNFHIRPRSNSKEKKLKEIQECCLRLKENSLNTNFLEQRLSSDSQYYNYQQPSNLNPFNQNVEYMPQFSAKQSGDQAFEVSIIRNRILDSETTCGKIIIETDRNNTLTQNQRETTINGVGFNFNDKDRIPSKVKLTNTYNECSESVLNNRNLSAVSPIQYSPKSIQESNNTFLNEILKNSGSRNKANGSSQIHSKILDTSANTQTIISNNQINPAVGSLIKEEILKTTTDWMDPTEYLNRKFQEHYVKQNEIDEAFMNRFKKANFKIQQQTLTTDVKQINLDEKQNDIEPKSDQFQANDQNQLSQTLANHNLQPIINPQTSQNVQIQISFAKDSQVNKRSSKDLQSASNLRDLLQKDKVENLAIDELDHYELKKRNSGKFTRIEQKSSRRRSRDSGSINSVSGIQQRSRNPSRDDSNNNKTASVSQEKSRSQSSFLKEKQTNQGSFRHKLNNYSTNNTSNNLHATSIANNLPADTDLQRDLQIKFSRILQNMPQFSSEMLQKNRHIRSSTYSNNLAFARQNSFGGLKNGLVEFSNSPQSHSLIKILNKLKFEQQPSLSTEKLHKLSEEQSCSTPNQHLELHQNNSNGKTKTSETNRAGSALNNFSSISSPKGYQPSEVNGDHSRIYLKQELGHLDLTTNFSHLKEQISTVSNSNKALNIPKINMNISFSDKCNADEYQMLVRPTSRENDYSFFKNISNNGQNGLDRDASENDESRRFCQRTCSNIGNPHYITDTEQYHNPIKTPRTDREGYQILNRKEEKIKYNNFFDVDLGDNRNQDTERVNKPEYENFFCEVKKTLNQGLTQQTNGKIPGLNIILKLDLHGGSKSSLNNYSQAPQTCRNLQYPSTNDIKMNTPTTNNPLIINQTACDDYFLGKSGSSTNKENFFIIHPQSQLLRQVSLNQESINPQKETPRYLQENRRHSHIPQKEIEKNNASQISQKPSHNLKPFQ